MAVVECFFLDSAPVSVRRSSGRIICFRSSSGDLPYVDDGIIEDQLGDEGLNELGRKEWQR